MQAWYEDAIRRLRVPVETRWCATRFGQTHVLVAGSESAPPLVALHGWGGNALGMARQLEGLSDVFRVYAPDTIGQTGKSADVRPPINGSAYAEWLMDVLDGLEISRARLVGVSGGGWLALRLATLGRERIARAALISSSGFEWPRLSLGAIPATLWPVLLPSPRSVRAFLRFLSAPGWVPSEDVLEMFERLFRHAAVRRLEPQPPFSDSELRAVRVPILLLEGEHERINSPQRTVARARALVADVQAELVPGVGHLMSEERPDLVNRRVREFMVS